MYEAGAVTGMEVLDAVWKRCNRQPAVAAEVAPALGRHASEGVRPVGGDLQRLLRQREEQVKDVEQVRRTSPLRPGARLALGGGYTAAYSPPWWLNGRKEYRATFLGFAGRGPGKMPVGLVELDSEIDRTEGCGQRHKGRYALLRLLHMANWEGSGTVTVHVVESLPEDVEAFSSSHPFGTEIETHATYTAVNEDRATGTE